MSDMSSPDLDLTQRLNAGSLAEDRELMNYVYREMRRLAQRALQMGQAAPTLSTGAVVNEAYLRLFGEAPHRFNDRGHFLAMAATAMRHILVDYARARMAEKRGAGNVVSLDELSVLNAALDQDAEQIAAIDEALVALAALDPRACKVFEMRVLADIDISDVAKALGLSEPTVKRDARFAKAFVAERLGLQQG